MLPSTNSHFQAIEFYTSSSNGIHLITLFSACCFASGIIGCWLPSLYLALRNVVNLKIPEPKEHFNGCWKEHLFRQQYDFLPLRNFPGAQLRFSNWYVPSHQVCVLLLRGNGAERGASIQTALDHIKLNCSQSFYWAFNVYATFHNTFNHHTSKAFGVFLFYFYISCRPFNALWVLTASTYAHWGQYSFKIKFWVNKTFS